MELPKGNTPVTCKWVFAIKCKADGTIDRYTKRFVVKRYTQTSKIDYQENFAPMIKMKLLKCYFNSLPRMVTPSTRC